jgi:ATP-dependent protease HslVU (ClpYQ) peptidase subunit|tara:strand:- start:36 stop:488 length:453 start_codon:yes stop_codon:yes gene_type:complete
MTTIAYRDGIIASDSQETYGDGRIGYCKKLYRLKDVILATSGDSYTGLIFVDWYERGARLEDAPDLSHVQSDEDFECLVIEDLDNIYTINRFFQKYPIEMPDGFCAIGWGSPYAIASMEMGADARKAVQVASKYDCYTGGKIKVMKVRNS